MNRNRKTARRRAETIRVWTHDEAQGALSYITSIMNSLREHWMNANTHDRRARRLAALPGRADRKRYLAEKEETTLARQAHDRFDEAVEELHGLDIFCIDPVAGEAVIPFVHKEQLAWFVYDLFNPGALRFWRYHNDPLETRRPVAEALEGADETPQVV